MALIDVKKIDKAAERRKMRRLMENMDVIGYNFQIPKHLYDRFKKKLCSMGKRRHMREKLIDLITKYLDESEGNSRD